MNAIIRSFIAAALSATILLAGLRPLESRAEMEFDAIEEYLLAEMEGSNIPGLAVSIVQDDQIVFLKGYGRADPSGRAVTGQTPFIIGSVTKSFTALAVMQLVEAGQIELDAPAQRYLPWFRVADPEASARITVRHLLNHTSGLPLTAAMETMTWTDGDENAIENHVRYLAGAELNRPVGESFQYSNANYIILGLIVQTVSGQPYETYVQEQIFAPLGLVNSYASQDEAIRRGMATGHRWWFGAPLPATFPYNRGDLPAGYIIACAEDMAHYLIAQMHDGRYRDVSVLSPSGVALMHTEPIPGTYGMGWYVGQFEGRTVIGHEGATFNFQSATYFDPQARVGVFVAANAMAFLEGLSPQGSTTHRLAMNVLRLATGGALPDQGLRITTLFWIVNAIVLFLTGLAIVALARMPGRFRRLRQRGSLSPFGLTWRVVLAALLHFVWPAGLLYLTLTFPAWEVIVTMQPDLGYWLNAMALVTFGKGVVEIVALGQTFRQGRRIRPVLSKSLPLSMSQRPDGEPTGL